MLWHLMSVWEKVRSSFIIAYRQCEYEGEIDHTSSMLLNNLHETITSS